MSKPKHNPIHYMRGAYQRFYELMAKNEDREAFYEQGYMSGKIDALLDMGLVSTETHNRIKHEEWKKCSSQ